MKKMVLSALILSVVTLSGCDNDNKISNKNYDHTQTQSDSITQKTQNIEYIKSLLKNTYNFNAGEVNDDLNKKLLFSLILSVYIVQDYF